MPPHKFISSLQNPEIRRLQHWNQKSRDRRKDGRFVLEGLREFRLALSGGYRTDALYYCPDILSDGEARELADRSDAPLTGLSREVYAHLAYRGKTEGLIAVIQARDHSLASLELPNPEPLVLVAEAPEKPGNLGALLRTADAAGLDAVLVADLKGDLYNPNTIRSSLGCLFTVPVAVADSATLIAFLRERRIRILAAALGGSLRYDRADYTPATAIAVGTEATGLTPAWTDAADARVEIPMAGQIDSMNVSVAAAVLIFEARRQRGFVPDVEK